MNRIERKLRFEKIFMIFFRSEYSISILIPIFLELENAFRFETYSKNKKKIQIFFGNLWKLFVIFENFSNFYYVLNLKYN